MAITVKHTKVSTIPDGDDSSLIRPSDWNDDHVLTGTIPVANGGTGAATLTGYVKGTGTTAMTASSTIPNTDITGLGTASTKDAGVANGVATLDGSGTVPISQLPSAVLGALSYQGTWNASTNTPTLTSSVGTKGYYYVVSVAGSTNLNGITDWVVGDWAVFNGSVWQKVDNTDAVTSVNGYTGTVVLTNTDISGFGTMSTQNANSVAITGGSINGTTIGATTASTGAFTTATASTSLTTPIVQASNSGGLSLKNSAGTTQISMGGGGGDNVSINVATNINGVNAQIDISPTGTGHVHMKPTGTGSIEIAPTNVGTMDNMTIGATTARAITGTTITATTFSGSGASLTSIPNSALVNSAITINGTSTSLGGSISVGTVTSVTGTSPVVSSGGTTPTISMPAATTSVSGYLTSTDWNTFNSKGTGTVTSVTATSPVTSTGGTTPVIAMPAATGSVNGYLTSTDWTTFNSKGSGSVTSVGGTGTVNGITLTGTVTTSGSLTLGGTLSGVSLTTQVSGTLPIANGGTGATTRQDAMDALAGSTTSGSYLRGNGTDVVMSTIQAADVPTLNQNTTGTSSNVTGTVAIANGGTGQTTATAAFNALNPMTTTGDIIYEASPTTAARLGIGSTGQVLTVAGGLPSWAAAPSSNITTLGLYENSATISANYTIGTGNNAMSAGPITINTGVTVTVPTGSTWVIV
jgi:hypothetical protein